ncbi:hypothetical protein GJAV_G00055920 [Gymnothorax javanicus]|nr:hypothetical protein GJAV_G00055920 [Gymnothorax javanicus]
MDAHAGIEPGSPKEAASNRTRDEGSNNDSEKRGDCALAPTHQKIGVFFCGSTPLLWRAADVKAARENGVVGTLVGSLARQPRQNNRLGRPLELLQEEARLLRETNQAELFSPSERTDAATDSQGVEQYREKLERSYEEQKILALQERKAAMAVQLHTARAGLSHSPEERHFLAADWPRPRDERSETRFRVFRDLRKQGFYLTSAGKFGGDYLVYPGDPLRFHAHFIALCVPMDAATPLYDLLAISRLGANVKKTVLLCSPSEDGVGGEEEEVVYTSLQWSGMA